MNLRERLMEFFAEWRRWTLAETEALQAHDWLSLARYQTEKKRLQQALWPLPPFGPIDVEVQTAVKVLTSMELANLALLARHRATTETQHNQLGTASRLLHRVQQSYSRAGGQLWEWYS